MAFKLEVLLDTPARGVTRVYTCNKETSSYHSTDIGADGTILVDYRNMYSPRDYKTYEEHHAFAHDKAVRDVALAQQNSLYGVKVPDWLRRHATFMYQEGYTCTAPDMLRDWFRECHPDVTADIADITEYIKRFV